MAKRIYLTLAEAEKISGIKRTTLKYHCLVRNIKALKIDGTRGYWLVNPTALDAFMKKRRMPEHDCKNSPEDGCEVCSNYLPEGEIKNE